MPAKRIVPAAFCSNCEVGLTEANRSDCETQCKDCRRDAKRASYRRVDTEKAMWRHKRRTYGIDQQTFEDMLKDQNNACKICGTQFATIRDIDGANGRMRRMRDIHIDHCHTTGRIRGLLCQRCNLAVGWIEKDDFLHERLLAYLADTADAAVEAMRRRVMTGVAAADPRTICCIS